MRLGILCLGFLQFFWDSWKCSMWWGLLRREIYSVVRWLLPVPISAGQMTVEKPSAEWLDIRHLNHPTGSGEGSTSHSSQQEAVILSLVWKYVVHTL